MPLGTLHWIPHGSGDRGRPFRVTRARLRTVILLVALIVTGLSAVSFHLGHLSGVDRSSREEDLEMELLRGELFHLSQRVSLVTETLEEISTREEQVLMAGAGLNMDFSGLLPAERGPVQPPEKELFSYIDDLELRLLLAERLAEAELLAYDSLSSYLVEVSDELCKVPSIWPTDGVFVSDFGPRIDPFTGAVRYHKGIDIAAPSGTPVYAPADGVVTFTGWTGGWGLNVVVRHTEDLSTRYAHCSSACANVGQRVRRGDLLARVGSTGRSVAPHLHYEVLIQGVQVDPEDYIVGTGPEESVF